MDIVGPPKVVEPPKTSPEAMPSSLPDHPARPTPVHHGGVQSHQANSGQRSGLGLVIFATIVIVFGLGACMVYAYLRTNGISIL